MSEALAVAVAGFLSVCPDAVVQVILCAILAHAFDDFTLVFHDSSVNFRPSI